MKLFAVLMLLCVACSNLPSLRAQTETAAPADVATYGEFPTKYQQIVGRWLEKILADPTSAVLEWGDPPKAGDYTTQKGERFVGYVVDLKVNSRNRFGSSTGKQKYRVVIRDGEVVWGGRPRS